MILSGMVGLIGVAFVAFGWWTIGFPRRRMWGGLVLLVTTFLFAPWLLVMSGERYGFDGVVAGLVGLSLAIGGGFFSQRSVGRVGYGKSAKCGRCLKTLICSKDGIGGMI